MGWISEFRDFALKGNVLDLAVGVIIGGAFGKVVASLTNDILLPPIGKLIGGVDFSKLELVLGEAPPGKDAAAAAIKYGMFINTIIDFVIVAFAIFIVVKAFNHAKKRFEAQKPAAAPPGPTTEQKLLTEIRDLLAKR